ncbi:LexA family protein [Pseudomonas lopnurensis]|uniref:LexA family protein n=1 Tax=Pseudomonas lopnurensis TaxID=1477517 RepID=UPI0028AC42A1|nr:S24 family peptidase [Pseudomonas lopnurensis]
MSLTILGRQVRRKFLLDESHQLRITGFQSPAADDMDRPLSLDALVNLGAPHIWPVRVDDHSLQAFGMYQGDILIVDRSAAAVADCYLVVDMDGAYLVRMAVKQGDSLALRSPQDCAACIPLLEVDVFGVVIGGYWSARPF